MPNFETSFIENIPNIPNTVLVSLRLKGTCSAKLLVFSEDYSLSVLTAIFHVNLG